MIVGLQHYRKLPASSDTQFAVQPQKLAEAVAADLQQGLIPFYFLGTVGKHHLLLQGVLRTSSNVLPQAVFVMIAASGGGRQSGAGSGLSTPHHSSGLAPRAV